MKSKIGFPSQTETFLKKWSQNCYVLTLFDCELETKKLFECKEE